MTDAQARPRQAVMARLPVVAVSSHEELAALLRKWRWLFRERVVIELGERPEADSLLDGFLVRLRSIEPARRERALQWAMRRLREQCYRWRRQLDAADAARAMQRPTDPVLGELSDDMVAAVRRLPHAQREALQLAIGEQLGPQEIAERLQRPRHAIAMRLYRARDELREQFPELACLLGGLALRCPRTMARRFLAWCHRRGLTTGSWSAVTDSCAQVTLATVIALVGWGSATSAPSAAALAGLRLAPSAAAVATGSPSARSIPSVVSHSPAWAAGRVPPSGPPAPALPRVANAELLRTPAEETPDDTQLSTAAAAGDGHDFTVVALGYGRSCQCAVLFQSTDRGHTWYAASVPAPPDAVQVVLPPAYPRDPRIFLGSSAVGGGASYVVPAFDDVALPLGPAGLVTLAASFDAGDDRAFVATEAGVLAVNADHGTAAAALVMTYGAGQPAALAPASAGSRTAVLALAPPGSAPIGDAVAPTTAPAVFGCGGPSTSCVLQAPVQGDAAHLAADPSRETVAMWGPDGIALSNDGGHGFGSLPRAPGTVGTIALDGSRVWAIVVRGSAPSLVWTSAAPGGTWTMADSPIGTLGASTFLLAAPGGRLIDLLAGGGLACTADGGGTWSSNCP